jgi:hypothetical protein
MKLNILRVMLGQRKVIVVVLSLTFFEILQQSSAYNKCLPTIVQHDAARFGQIITNASTDVTPNTMYS